MNPWKDTLGTFSLIMLAMGCLVALVNRARPHTVVIPPPIQVGQFVEDLKALHNPIGGKTLLLALSPTCQPCEESFAELHSLVTRRNAVSSQTAIVVACASTDQAANEARILLTHHIQVDSVISMDLNKARIWLYPTALLVDEGGRVLQIWNGALTPEISKRIGEHL